jgi:cytochrome b involved in lipid metabolism
VNVVHDVGPKSARNASRNVHDWRRMRRISATEMARHTHVQDCWMAVHGKVYDVSKYLDMHPGQELPNVFSHEKLLLTMSSGPAGGVDIMMEVAGTDATFEFEVYEAQRFQGLC